MPCTPLSAFRRLTINYEFLAETVGTMIEIAFIQIMLNKFVGQNQTVSYLLCGLFLNFAAAITNWFNKKHDENT